MKLDRIKFANLIAFLSVKVKHQLDENDINELDRLTEMNVEPVADIRISTNAVDELLAAINAEGKLIEAVKAYRSLTGAGLKESKDAVERYRNVKPAVKSEAKLDDILNG